MPLDYLYSQDQQICAQCNLSKPVILITGSDIHFPVPEDFHKKLMVSRLMIRTGAFNEVSE